MSDVLPPTRPGGLSFDEAMPPSQIFFSLTGRISRRVFWLWGVGAMVLTSIVASLLLASPASVTSRSRWWSTR